MTVIPAAAFLLLAVSIALFFRDPVRVPPLGDNLILAPADGTVLTEENSINADCGSQGLSIFLSLTDVHVNRIPVNGVVQSVEYRPGKFRLAWRKDASESNEMNRIVIANESGEVIIQQVTGTVARRVICHLRPGDVVKAGQRFGIMKFGSRIDLVFPENVKIKVKPGDKVKAGVTIIGEWIK